jgi:pyruvate dehydrogenase E1 component alpha subunit
VALINAPDRATLIEMYRRLQRIRLFDDMAAALHAKGEIPGPLHTTHGQEGEVVGACMALETGDYMVGNHRSHGHPIGKGAKVGPLMAELLGRATGVCGGKGGSMHLADFSVGSLGETSIVGSGIPVAAGAALGAQMMGNGCVSLCFFGDGASNQGVFHEALNMAAIWKLPAIFVCENNGYAVTTSIAYSAAVPDIAIRATGYGMPGEIVDGQDVLAVYDTVSRAVARARAGEGPSLIEAKTYRFFEHACGLGRDLGYRTDAELAAWQARDPVTLFRDKLHNEFDFAEADLAAVDDGVRAEIDEAVAGARAAPYPALETAFTDVFAAPRGAPARQEA